MHKFSNFNNAQVSDRVKLPQDIEERHIIGYRLVEGLNNGTHGRFSALFKV